MVLFASDLPGSTPTPVQPSCTKPAFPASGYAAWGKVLGTSDEPGHSIP